MASSDHQNLTLKTKSGRIIATKVWINPNLVHRRFLRNKKLHPKLAWLKKNNPVLYLERLEKVAGRAIDENIKLKATLEKIKATVGKI